MIFTTNESLNQWGRVLHGEDLEHAIIDRVFERGRFLTLDGPSMRTRRLGIDDPPRLRDHRQGAINRPEFPAPESSESPPIRAGASERDDAGGSGFDDECIHTEFGKPSFGQDPPRPS